MSNQVLMAIKSVDTVKTYRSRDRECNYYSIVLRYYYAGYLMANLSAGDTLLVSLTPALLNDWPVLARHYLDLNESESQITPVTIRNIYPSRLSHRKVTIMVLIDPLTSIYSLSIGPLIPEIRVIQILTLKPHGQGNGWEQVKVI